MTGTLKQHPNYGTWTAMHTRCRNPNQKCYKHYGGRGIKVCARWSSFLRFVEDMGCKPSKAHSIDRIDVHGDYEPGNCRWVTQQVQSRTRPCVKLSPEIAREIRNILATERISQTVLAKRYGVTQAIISKVNRHDLWRDD